MKRKKSKRKISTGVVIGLIAIGINIITVSVYIYQTNIMREQQHASVWPYLEWRSIYNQNDGFMLQVRNNGVGPALITSSKMRINGEDFLAIDSLLIEMLGTTSFPYLKGEINNRVLPAGQSINLIKSEDPKWSELLFGNLRSHQFELEINYESIYGDKWICEGLTVYQIDPN